jgi:hypothetical protein
MSGGGRSSVALVRDAKADSDTPSGGVESKVDMRYLIRALIKYNASDLHLKVGRPPMTGSTAS